MENKVHIKYLDLSHGVVIENDKIVCSVQESEADDALELDEAFAELIDMAEKIDKYYEN